MAKLVIDYDAIVGPGERSALNPDELSAHVAQMDIELIRTSATPR